MPAENCAPADYAPTDYSGARALIADRLATATQAGDARRDEAYAGCFTEHGALQLDQTIAPRTAIRDWMAGASIIPSPGATATPGYVSHHLTTMQITLTSPTTAKARTYWFVITAIGPDHSGYYDDQLELHGVEWLIAHRRPRTLWFHPNSLVRPTA